MNAVALPTNPGTTAAAAQTLEQVSTGRAQALAREATALDPKKDAEVWKVAEGFEAMFLHIMLKQMRDTTMNDEESPFHSHSTRMYQAMLDEKVAEVGSHSRQFGIARMIHDHLVGKPAKPANSEIDLTSKIRRYQAVQEFAPDSERIRDKELSRRP